MSTQVMPDSRPIICVFSLLAACYGPSSPVNLPDRAAPEDKPIVDAGVSTDGAADSGDARDAEAGVTAPAPAPAPDPDIVKIINLSNEEKFAYARAHASGFDSLRLASKATDFSRLGKDGSTVAFYTPEELLQHGADTKAGSCRRVVFAVNLAELRAEIPSDGGEGRPTLKKSGSFEELVLNDSVLMNGPYSRTITKNARGEIEETMSGYSSGDQVGDALLEITDDAILYGTVPVTARAVCESTFVSACATPGGGASTCERCKQLGVALTSLMHGHGFGRAPPVTVRSGVKSDEALPPCSACPEDTLSKELTRVNEALSGLALEHLSPEPWPVFYKKKPDCERIAKARAAARGGQFAPFR